MQARNMVPSLTPSLPRKTLPQPHHHQQQLSELSSNSTALPFTRSAFGPLVIFLLLLLIKVTD